MSTETQAEATAVAAPAVNPVPLGLFGFLPAGITLGLWLLGYLPAADLGLMVPAVWASAALFLLIGAVAALRAGANAVAAVLGGFSAFWASLGLLLAALTNGWLGATADTNALPTFLLAWLVTFVLMTIATLRLPLMFTVGFVLVDITVAVLLVSVLNASSALQTISGVTCLLFCAVFAYIFVDGFRQELGGAALPMGNPISR